MDSYDWQAPNSNFATPKIFVLKTREGSSSGTVVATDTITIYGIQDGDDGTNTFKVQIGNETFWGGGGPSVYGNFATSSVTYVLHFRRINWYDVIDGASKVWSSNPTGAAANAFVLNNVDSKDGDSWLNYFSLTFSEKLQALHLQIKLQCFHSIFYGLFLFHVS